MCPPGIKAMRRMQQNEPQPTGSKRWQRYEDGFTMLARGRCVLCPLTALGCHRETITDDKERGGVCMIRDGLGEEI